MSQLSVDDTMKQLSSGMVINGCHKMCPLFDLSSELGSILVVLTGPYQITASLGQASYQKPMFEHRMITLV